MTKKEKLMQTIHQEQADYLARISTMSTMEVVNHAYEICYREELASVFEGIGFDDAELDFLLTLPNPIGFMYAEWLKTDASVCQMLEDTIRDVLPDNPCDSCNRDICYGCPHQIDEEDKNV